LKPAQRIDQDVQWNAAWLASIRDCGQQIANASDWRVELNLQAQNRQLRNCTGLPVQFVSQRELPAGESYESYIFASGKVPTRDNLHDFFNALIWLTFPRIKAQLNAQQAMQIERLGIGKSRGAARDAATLFDENAAILAVIDNPEGRDLVVALSNHDWQPVLFHGRERFNRLAQVILFGHALIEKLVRPYKAITAHTLVCWVDADFHRRPPEEQHAILDAQLATQLQAQPILPDAFSPLPIAGIPGWWPDQDAQFYADTGVFRPKRQKVQ
jgi:hypothetical protein